MERLQPINELSIKQQEHLELLPSSLVQRCHIEARKKLVERFEGDNVQQYHNLLHTESVSKRAQTIGEIIMASSEGKLITPRDLQLIDVITSWHDVVQDFEVELGEEVFELKENKYHFPKKSRKRYFGQNERESTGELLMFTDQIEFEMGQQYFTKRDKSIMKTSIDATIPHFDAQLRTVTQPNLGDSPHPIALIVAMADLATAPMEGEKRFLAEGIALFKEDNLDIEEGLSVLWTKPIEYRLAWGEYIRKRILQKQDQQLNFVIGRKQLFDTDIASLPPMVQSNLRKEFIFFDDAIQGQQAQIEVSKEKEIGELLGDYGYLN